MNQNHLVAGGMVRTGDAVTGELSGKSVLVVDDEPFIAMDLKETLEASGAKVVTADSRAEALALIADSTFDAAVLDVHLNDGASYTIADELRRMGVPFAFLSGYFTIRDGYQDIPFLAKPFSKDDAVAAIVKLAGG